MCTNWILPFVAGVFVGQEIQEAPKVRPYIEAGIRKVMEISKDIFQNVQHQSEKSSDPNASNAPDDERKTWWSNKGKKKET